MKTTPNRRSRDSGNPEPLKHGAGYNRDKRLSKAQRPRKKSRGDSLSAMSGFPLARERREQDKAKSEAPRPRKHGKPNPKKFAGKRSDSPRPRRSDSKPPRSAPNRRSRASGNPEHNRDKRLSAAPRPRKKPRDDSLSAIARPTLKGTGFPLARERRERNKANSKPPHPRKHGKPSDNKPPRLHKHDKPARKDDAPRKKRGIAISKWVSPALATPTAPVVDNTPSVTKVTKTPNTNAADKSEKVQKILSHCGMGARREMERLIEQGEVTVNGQTIQLGARATAKDIIAINGKPIARPRAQDRLLAYHKPKGKWVSREAGVDSVFDDLPELAEGRWLNIGRLDINTEGLLLFSTNGEWVQELAHPSNGYEREYHARVCGKIPAEEIRKLLTKGIFLAGEKRVLRPLAFELKSKHGEGINFWYRIVLSEGRNRAVRRIFEHYNLQISRLLRVRFGPYLLPKDLPPHHAIEISRKNI